MAATKPAFSVKRVQEQNGPFSYTTYRVTGWIGSRRVRKQFNDANEAYGEKLRLEVEAANADQIRAVHTRLRPEEIADAEAAIRRLAGVPLTAAVDWYLANYRPPIDEKPLADAITAFLAEKLAYVSPKVGREYKRELGKLGKAFPVAKVHDLDPTKAQDYMQAFGLGKKGWNNLRGYLHTFFQWCTARPRCWTLHNPIHGIPKHKIARGIPEVLTAAKVAELLRFLETYSGGERQKATAGCLV